MEKNIQTKIIKKNIFQNQTLYLIKILQKIFENKNFFSILNEFIKKSDIGVFLSEKSNIKIWIKIKNKINEIKWIKWNWNINKKN